MINERFISAHTVYGQVEEEPLAQLLDLDAQRSSGSPSLSSTVSLHLSLPLSTPHWFYLHFSRLPNVITILSLHQPLQDMQTFCLGTKTAESECRV